MGYLVGLGQPDHVMPQGNLIYAWDGSRARAVKSNTAGELGVQGSAPVKTIQTELLAAQSVGASAQVASTVLSLTAGIKSALIFIDHGRANTVAFGTNGTEYRIQLSQGSTQTNKWRTVASVVCASTACISVSASADVAVGATTVVVTSGTGIPTRGDVVFWANTVAASSSEWAKVLSVSGTASFVIEDGLDYAQDSDTNLFTQGENFVIAVDVKAATRLRVLVNNNASATTQPIYSRVACITES